MLLYLIMSLVVCMQTVMGGQDFKPLPGLTMEVKRAIFLRFHKNVEEKPFSFVAMNKLTEPDDMKEIHSGNFVQSAAFVSRCGWFCCRKSYGAVILGTKDQTLIELARQHVCGEKIRGVHKGNVFRSNC